MYMSKMISVGKACNGFVVECCVPFKPKMEKNAKDVCCSYPGSKDKQYVAKDATEVAALIQKLMPLLEDDYTSEKEFDSAFAEAEKSMGMKGEE